jgi:hypothetical protein
MGLSRWYGGALRIIYSLLILQINLGAKQGLNMLEGFPFPEQSLLLVHEQKEQPKHQNPDTTQSAAT